MAKPRYQWIVVPAGKETKAAAQMTQDGLIPVAIAPNDLPFSREFNVVEPYGDTGKIGILARPGSSVPICYRKVDPFHDESIARFCAEGWTFCCCCPDPVSPSMTHVYLTQDGVASEYKSVSLLAKADDYKLTECADDGWRLVGVSPDAQRKSDVLSSFWVRPLASESREIRPVKRVSMALFGDYHQETFQQLAGDGWRIVAAAPSGLRADVLHVFWEEADQPSTYHRQAVNFDEQLLIDRFTVDAIAPTWKKRGAIQVFQHVGKTKVSKPST